MTDSLLADCLRPGDRVVIGQAAAEPLGLVADLFELAPRLGGLDVFCGLSLNPAWETQVPDAVRVSTYLGMGTLRPLIARERVRIVPASVSLLCAMIASRKLAVDVVLLQVSPADADGYHSLGCTLDYVWDAVQAARVVVVEVNPNMPITRNAGRLHRSGVVVARQSDTPLPESAPEQPSEVQRQIADHVAGLVPDGATLQLGIGGLAVAVAEALKGKRRLKVRSAMAGDWLLHLVESGAIATGEPDCCLASLGVGTRLFYQSLSREGVLGFATPAQLAVPVPEAPLMAINSGIEVDVTGQVNAELVGERYVGAVGGQTDFFRAARASAGGLAILALPSTTGAGVSRIVARCRHVTSAQSDVDIVVTEHGAADIRATTLKERRLLIARVAHPRAREALLLEAGGGTAVTLQER